MRWDLGFLDFWGFRDFGEGARNEEGESWKKENSKGEKTRGQREEREGEA